MKIFSTFQLLFILLLLCVSLIPSRTDAIPNTTSLDNGLVAYYSFNDGTAKDNSGNNHIGILNGPIKDGGVLGSGLSFDGINDYILIPPSNDFNFTNMFAISAWVKVRPYYSYITVLTKGNTSSMSTPYSIVYHKFGSQLIYPHIRFLTATTLIVEDGSNGKSLNENIWQFIVWSYSEGILSIYLNGVKVDQKIFSTNTIQTNDLPIEIGRDNPGSIELFYGSMDEIRIYNRPLIQEDILALYQQQKLIYLPLARR